MASALRLLLATAVDTRAYPRGAHLGVAPVKGHLLGVLVERRLALNSHQHLAAIRRPDEHVGVDARVATRQLHVAAGEQRGLRAGVRKVRKRDLHKLAAVAVAAVEAHRAGQLLRERLAAVHELAVLHMVCEVL